MSVPTENPAGATAIRAFPAGKLPAAAMPSGRTQPQLPGGNRGFDKSDQLADGVRLAGRADAGQLALTR